MHVFGETRATVSHTGVKELGPNAGVAAHAHFDVVDVGTDQFGETRQFVHEADPGGQHGVGGVLCEFGTAHIGNQHAFRRVQQTRVKDGHLFRTRFVAHTNNNAVGMHQVLNGRTLFEKLGIGHHRHRDVETATFELSVDQFAHLVAGSHRHGALVNHNHGSCDVCTDIPGRRVHIRHIGRPVFRLWRAHGNHLIVTVFGGGSDVCGELETTRRDGAHHDVVESGFVNRNLTGC